MAADAFWEAAPADGWWGVCPREGGAVPLGHCAETGADSVRTTSARPVPSDERVPRGRRGA
jgi:hypothetical protein